MKVLVLVLGFAAAGGFFSRLVQPSNSRAATARGVQKYQAGEFREAAEAFASVPDSSHGGALSLNRATALLAAGDTTAGLQAIERAVDDPDTAAAALYNRGTAHLKAKDYDRAIADYMDSLERDPSNRAAKRNLEIAMMRRQEQQQEEQGDGGSDQPAPRQPPPGEQPRPDEGDPLLRSIEQQEKEELSRMRRAAPGQKRVGW